MNSLPDRKFRLSGVFVLSLCLFLFFLSLCSEVTALPDTNTVQRSYVVVGTVVLRGNKLTRPDVILRELTFHERDTVPVSALEKALSTSRNNIFNTALFNFVTIDTLLHRGNQERMDVTISVTERWYIWPWPYFVISDRNLNTWLETMDLRQVTYGVDLTFFNLLGRNITLVFPLHFGFNQKFGMNITTPYVNRRKTLGFGIGASYERNHEVVVASSGNKPEYLSDENGYPRQVADVFATVNIRPNLYVDHTFRIDWQYTSFSDSLASVPGYPVDGTGNDFQYVSLSYKIKIDHRDIHFYPLQGYYADLIAVKYGIFSKTDVLSFRTSLRKYWRMAPRWYFATGLSGKVSFPAVQPYFLQQGLGYGREFIRGFEYYVIDGQHYITLKNNLKFALVPQRVLYLPFLRSGKFNKLPYAFYINAYADFGYVYDHDQQAVRNNDLQNRFLAGYGMGIDFTTYYDIVIRAEFSMNMRGEPGIYLHFIAPV